MIYFCFKSLVRTTTIIIFISVIRPPFMSIYYINVTRYLFTYPTIAWM